ncbi:MAG: hypothetical protein ACR2IV_22195 [Bryobacteraceae bacterium]
MSAKVAAALYSNAFAPVKVHVVPGLLDKVTELVLEGYATTPHGGLEIGGLLFGRRDSSFITVEDFRPLVCDHSQGPRFILSDRDERSLCDLIGAPAIDPALYGLGIVGWYCSHTRSDLLLLDRELVLHDTYFPGADDFVIVLKPRDLRNVSAGIFLRGADGIMDSQCPATILELPELDTARRFNRTAASNRYDLSPFSSRPVPPRVNEHACTLPYNASVIESAPADQLIVEPVSILANATVKASKHSRRPARWKVLLASLGAIALLCLGAWRFLQLTQMPPANLLLNLRPHAGKLLLSWKSNLVRPQRAHVDIFDGTSSEHLNITEIFQPSGVLLFTHHTGNVHAILTVETRSGAVVRNAWFTDPSAAIQNPASSEKNSESAPPTNLSASNTPGLNPPKQQLESKVPAIHHPRRRRFRRSHHKKIRTSSTPIPSQPGVSASQH